MRKEGSEVAEEQLGFVKSKPEHIKKHETQLLKNCKLLTGRVDNNYIFRLYDVYDA